MHAQAQSAESVSETPSPELTLRLILGGLAKELRKNAVIASDFHLVIEELANERLSNILIERMQALDLVSQTLIEIGRLLDRVNKDCPVDFEVPNELLMDIRLAALRDRLANKVVDTADDPDLELW